MDVKRGLKLLLSSVVILALLYVWYTSGNCASLDRAKLTTFDAITIPTEQQQPLSLEKESPTGGSTGRPSRFLYLTQTESCLPNRLLTGHVIGNETACRCDVLVLSYKTTCKENPHKHIEYLFNSSTSWGSGRNLLYEKAKKRGKVYLYYIFLDDDIGLSTSTPNTNPWREFEDFLEQIEPSIAAVDTDTNAMLQHILHGRQRKGCTLNQTASNYGYIPTPRFDPAMNAYHYEAVGYVLPYATTYDKKSWAYADLYFEIKCELTFAGQVVLTTHVTAKNSKHRPYPRGIPLLRSGPPWLARLQLSYRRDTGIRVCYRNGRDTGLIIEESHQLCVYLHLDHTCP